MDAVGQLSHPAIPQNARAAQAVSAPPDSPRASFLDTLKHASTSGKQATAQLGPVRPDASKPARSPRRSAGQGSSAGSPRNAAAEPSRDIAGTSDGIHDRSCCAPDAAQSRPGSAEPSDPASGAASNTGPDETRDDVAQQQVQQQPCAASQTGLSGGFGAAAAVTGVSSATVVPPGHAAPVAPREPAETSCEYAGCPASDALPTLPACGGTRGDGDSEFPAGISGSGNTTAADCPIDNNGAAPGAAGFHALLIAGSAEGPSYSAGAAPSAAVDTAASGQIPGEIQFAQANHPEIVSAIASRGPGDAHVMRIRLNPPELGAVLVRVDMRDGALAASFQTSTGEAARLLTHTLGDLRQALETRGISVHNLDVRQAPPDVRGDGARGDTQQHQQFMHHDFQQQQRRHLLRHLWQRLAGDRYVLDVVA